MERKAVDGRECRPQSLVGFGLFILRCCRPDERRNRGNPHHGSAPRGFCCRRGSDYLLAKDTSAPAVQADDIATTRTLPEHLVAHRCFCVGGVRTGTIPSIRGRAMLVSLSDQVRECLRYAQDCVQQAASQTDPRLRRDYLIIGACWLKLSSELSEQLKHLAPSATAAGPTKETRRG